MSNPAEAPTAAELNRKLDEVLENQAWSMARQRAWRTLLRWVWVLLGAWTLLLAANTAMLAVLVSRG